MTKNYAHRGFCSQYPENTLLAFEKAIELGCDGLETDVQFSKDKELVMFHDEWLDRTTTGKGFVKDHTLKELKELDASYPDKFGDKFKGQKIPTLREYFEMVKDLDFVTNIELKTSVFEYLGIVEETLKLIDEYSLRDRIIISSFNHYTVKQFKALAPDVKCGFLFGDWVIDAGKYVKAQGIECAHPIYNNLTDEYFKEMKDAGREINSWTINEYSDIERLAKMGIDSIISNYPDRVKEVLDKLK